VVLADPSGRSEGFSIWASDVVPEVSTHCMARLLVLCSSQLQRFCPATTVLAHAACAKLSCTHDHVAGTACEGSRQASPAQPAQQASQLHNALLAQRCAWQPCFARPCCSCAFNVILLAPTELLDLWSSHIIDQAHACCATLPCSQPST